MRTIVNYVATQLPILVLGRCRPMLHAPASYRFNFHTPTHSTADTLLYGLAIRCQ